MADGLKKLDCWEVIAGGKRIKIFAYNGLPDIISIEIDFGVSVHHCSTDDLRILADTLAAIAEEVKKEKE